MPPNSNRWKAVSESEYAWEREALEFIRERLPDREPFRAWANFEFVADDGSVNEVDLLALTPKGFFLVEIKSRPGVLRGDAGTWTWETDGRFFTTDNPLIGANRKARKLASLLKRQKAARKSRLPFLEALVFCSAEDLNNKLDPAGRTRICLRDRPGEGGKPDRPGIMAALLERKAQGLRGAGTATVDRPAAKTVSRAMDQAGIRESQRARRVSDYRLTEIIEEGPGYQDWRAVHATLPEVERRIRIYLVRRAADEAERRTIARAASREFQLLENLHHPGVLRTHGFSEHELGSAIIFEHHPRAMRLDHFLAQRGPSLEPDHRLHFLRQIAETLQHAHQKHVFHRALCPRSILVTDPAKPFPALKVFNWQSGSRDQGTSVSRAVSATEHVDRLVEDASTAYMAPESLHSPEAGGEHLDVFSLGAVAFHLFTNRPPAANALELSETLRTEGGLQVSAVINGAGEALQDLVREATHPDVTIRLDTVKDFLGGLELVEEELTMPDEQKGTVDDPNRAQAGDWLPGGFPVVKRLGSGSSSVVFLVRHEERDAILKVARDVDHNDRIRQEAEVLRKLFNHRVVKFYDLVEIGDRAAILMRALTRSLKNDRREVETLRDWLRREGRLQLDLLERFGGDLLEAVRYLDEEGFSHRDIKPDNLAVANVGNRDELHLVLFDFSLSRAPVDSIRVGTRGYIDPFLPLREPRQWDSYAERWSAAVTLYEMASGPGQFPVWGDGRTDPVHTEGEAAIDAEGFESGVREELAKFFRKAFRREPGERFDNAAEMLYAWRDIFRNLDQSIVSTTTTEEDDAPAALPRPLETARLDTQIPELGFGTRSLNALDRLNVLTVADLLREPITRLFRMRGVGQKTRREITEAVQVLRARLGRPESEPLSSSADLSVNESEENGAEPASPGVDLLADRITRYRGTRDPEARKRIIRALLGLGEGESGETADPWPTQAETARRLEMSRARVGQVLTAFRERWRKNSLVTGLRDDLAAILHSNGGVMTLPEMVEAVLTARGSAQEAPLRARLAGAVIRAAAEVERTLATPRFLIRREGDRILVAEGPELADYALRLGAAADEMAMEDPLLPPVRVMERLRAVPAVAEAEPLHPARLLRIAVGAARVAALSSRQEIYPRGMGADRAVKLSQGALLGVKKLTPAEVRRRVAGRYPEAAPLPDPPDLDRLLTDAGLELRWDSEAENGRGAYRYPTWEPRVSGTVTTLRRYPTGSGDGPPAGELTPEAAEARQFEERLNFNRSEGGFIALTTSPRWYIDAIGLLERRFRLRVFDLEAAFLSALEATAGEKRVRWEKIVEADAAPAESRDWGRLLQLVRMAMPRLEAELFSAREFLLICFPGLLARYDQMGLLTELRDRAGRAPETGGIPGVWLLISGDDQSHLPVLEGQAVPVIGAGQHARVPESWLENRHRGRRTADSGSTAVSGSD
ncbi:MAG: BREX system serine/threonine kinase PglW [Desulfococcaceae bacterium]